MVAIKQLLVLAFWAVLSESACAATSVHSTTPIHHLIVVMLQDQSFDRYFGHYPVAENRPGEQAFHALANTPAVDGFTPALLNHNSNLSNPYRMSPGEPTCDLGYGAIAQRRAYNGGKNNMFIWQENEGPNTINDDGCFPNSVMGYYDGNTVHALWEYAQHGAMADHLFASDYATSAGGLIDLIAGTTLGVLPKLLPGVSYRDLLIDNDPPLYDDASHGRFRVHLTRKNIGDLLNQHHIPWGAFIGGFKPDDRNQQGRAEFHARSINQMGSLIADYNPLNDPFQYFKSTANPHHLPPSSMAEIGHNGMANHQYDLSFFGKVLEHHQLPSVSFIIPKAAQNGHVGNSSPLDEQAFLMRLMSSLKESAQWPSTAVMFVWSNSNGWYDHATPPAEPKGMTGTGYGPRLPFVVVSKWAKQNYVEHHMLDQSSVLRFIETNWHLGYLGGHTPDRYAYSLKTMFLFH